MIVTPDENEELADYLTRATVDIPVIGEDDGLSRQYCENVYREVNNSVITENAKANGDPTNTKTLRKKFSAQMYKRFRAVKGAINNVIKEINALGIKGGGNSLNAELSENFDINVPPVRQFEFTTRDNRHGAFMEWLEETMERGVLGKPRDISLNELDQRWTDEWVQRAYRKGVRDADVRARNVLPGQIEEKAGDAGRLIGRPVHAQALETVFSRTFSELKGINSAVEQQVSRELADSLAEGIGSEQTARRITDRVDKIGLTRARMLARTETINAYNEAALNEYQRLGFNKVAGKAEWLTAGDLRVCPRCAGMEGIVLSIDEARGIIPSHPNCRCTWIPVVDDDRVGGRLSTKRKSGTLGNLPTGDRRRAARENL